MHCLALHTLSRLRIPKLPAQAKEAAVERAEAEEQKLRDLAEKKAEKKRQDAALAKAATENLERQRMRAEARVKEQEENQRIALLQV